MIFQQVKAGGDRNFGYIVGDENKEECAIIDPSFAPESFIELASKLKLKIVYVICTHSHSDHSEGCSAIKQKTGAQIVMHKLSPFRADVLVDDGDMIRVGDIELRVIHTPGHTQDSICILAGNKLMTGDTLFVGKIGGTDNDRSAKIEFDSLFNKLMKLDDSIEVYPGHDYGVAPSSTIGNERRTNPFLLRTKFEDFKWLKDNWAEYKRKHNIK